MSEFSSSHRNFGWMHACILHVVSARLTKGYSRRHLKTFEVLVLEIAPMSKQDVNVLPNNFLHLSIIGNLNTHYKHKNGSCILSVKYSLPNSWKVLNFKLAATNHDIDENDFLFGTSFKLCCFMFQSS